MHSLGRNLAAKLTAIRAPQSSLSPVVTGVSYDRASMGLHYLDFDFSGDAHGQGTYDAMASAAPGQLPALEAEVLQVLAWAERLFGRPAAPDEGDDWDFDLQGVREVATPLAVRWQPGAASLELQPGPDYPPRVTLTLTLTGSEAFCAAFRAEFGAG
jgi:hypothetical protein